MKINEEICSTKPVEYYNKYNRYNKENKDNKYVDGQTIYQVNDLNQDNICPADASGLASLSASQSPGEPFVSCVGNAEEELPILNEDMIARAIIQLFDNDSTTQRYKVKIRLNLVDKENPEFIAPVTKDWGNFKKYIPEECREVVMSEVKQLRKAIKDQYGAYPYIGKFHLNTGKQPGKTKSWIQVEPFTYAVVWYSPVAEHWMCFVRMYDWQYKCDLISTDVTPAQHKVGVHSQHLYINPKHDKRKRPMTWAERRKANK
jgi:hypothetical protein